MRLKAQKTRLVVLEKKTVTTDSYNQPVEAWNPTTDIFSSGEVFMEKWDQGGKETDDGQTTAFQDVRFKCRYIEGLNKRDYRINEAGVLFDIENIKELGRKEGQILITQKQDNK